MAPLQPARRVLRRPRAMTTTWKAGGGEEAVDRARGLAIFDSVGVDDVERGTMHVVGAPEDMNSDDGEHDVRGDGGDDPGIALSR